MVERIRCGRDGRVRFFSESTEGFPALDLARRKIGAERLLAAPAEMLVTDRAGDAAVVAFVHGSSTGRMVMKALDVRCPKLPCSAYHVEVVNRPRRVLVVAGGDLFGMLAGLADAFLHGEMTRGALLYRGGVKTERPAFPLRYYWTWDHSTNWVLDDPGNQFTGAANRYLKRPETFLEDYRRLVDHCLEMRFNGIVIWGFLRAAHGGEAYAYEVAKYAADRGVAIMPGLGTTGYGGVYYEGRHPCNLETYLAENPQRGNMGPDGLLSRREISPYHPQNQAWIERCVEWLYRSFPIGGANLENMDLLVDSSPAGRRGRAKIKSGEADHFKDQFFAYKQALDVAHAIKPEAWNTYATYTGFGRGEQVTNGGADMGREPYYAKRMPPSAIAQWTLSGMVSATPIPLREWMDHPRPPRAYKNPHWPKGLRPPTPRSAGFVHQGSACACPGRRTDVALSTFAETCLRSHEAGLEGVCVHGEVTSRSHAWRLNYLAMRHWTYHPESTLEEFAVAELAPQLGGEKEARAFVEMMCRIEEDDIGAELEKEARKIATPHRPGNDTEKGSLVAWQMWEALREWNCLKDNNKSIAHGNTHLA